VLPSPRDAKFPAGGVVFSSSGGTGAYSSVWEGLACGIFRADGRLVRSKRLTRPARTKGG
jgi:hypothetical protein